MVILKYYFRAHFTSSRESFNIINHKKRPGQVNSKGLFRHDNCGIIFIHTFSQSRQKLLHLRWGV